VIDRSESQLISQDRLNRHRRQRQAAAPQRAPRKAAPPAIAVLTRGQ